MTAAHKERLVKQIPVKYLLTSSSLDTLFFITTPQTKHNPNFFLLFFSKTMSSDHSTHHHHLAWSLTYFPSSKTTFIRPKHQPLSSFTKHSSQSNSTSKRSFFHACDISPDANSSAVLTNLETQFSTSQDSSYTSNTHIPMAPKQETSNLSITKPISHCLIPGPDPLPVVGNALDILDCPLSELMLRYARQYGPLVKFSILADVLHLTSDPQMIQHITISNARNYLDRWTPPGFSALLYNDQLRGLVFSQGRYWMDHRKVVGSVFRSPQFLNHYVDTVTSKTQFLIQDIWKGKHLSTPLNIYNAMRMLTLDIIGTGAFGTEFNAMKNGKHEIEESLSSILGGILNIIKSPVPLWRVCKTPGRARLERNLKRLQKIEMQLINDRRRQLRSEKNTSDVDKTDLLGLLLQAKDSASNVNFTDEDLMWDVHDVIFAGHETTASALSACIFLVAGSDRVLGKIREEIDSVLPPGTKITLEKLQELRYLDMVMKEALRMYPPTALVGRIAKEDDVISGHEIPAGSNILISPYVMGRLERLWENPNEFIPERFAPEQVENRHPMVHTPFGSGPRVCLGSRMATMEAKAVLAILYSEYSFERTTDDLVVDYDSTVSFKSGMDMKLHKRETARS